MISVINYAGFAIHGYYDFFKPLYCHKDIITESMDEIFFYNV